MLRDPGAFRILRTPGGAPAARRHLFLHAFGVGLLVVLVLGVIGVIVSGALGDAFKRPDAWFWAWLALQCVAAAIIALANRRYWRLGEQVRAAGGALCRGCAYPLDGLDDDFICPECGRRDTRQAAIEAWKRVKLL